MKYYRVAKQDFLCKDHLKYQVLFSPIINYKNRAYYLTLDIVYSDGNAILEHRCYPKNLLRSLDVLFSEPKTSLIIITIHN